MKEVIPDINTNKKIGLAILKSLFGQIPIVNVFSAFCNEYVNSNWQERIEFTQETLLKRFSELDEKFEEKIRERKNFASLLGTAYQSALTDIEEEKIPLYINSLINAINNEDLDNTKIHIFLIFLKDFTLMHIKVLEFFRAVNCNGYRINLTACKMNSKKDMNAEIIRVTRPELVKDVNLFDSVINDLYNKNLINVPALSAIDSGLLMQNNGISVRFTTDFGNEFLDFIKEN